MGEKDMDVIGQMAKSVDCPTPMFQTAASIYTAAMAQGLSQEDTASTAEVFALTGFDLGQTDGMLANIICTCPATKSAIAGPCPL